MNSKGYWVVLVLLTFAGHTSGQAPEGYYRLSPVALPDSVHEVWANGRVRISVTRQAATPFERELIAHAESLFPPADSIAAASRNSTVFSREAEEKAAAREGDRWWWINLGGVWLPYAVTGAAVAEYVDYVRVTFGKSRASGGSVALEYSAVARRVMDGDVRYVVELNVQFDHSCGPRCARSFSHSRTVRFDGAGAVLEIKGDRLPFFLVS